LDCLQAFLFQKHNVNLHHIESRPSKQLVGDYDFFVSCDNTHGGLKEAITDLREMSETLTVLSRGHVEEQTNGQSGDAGECI
jgi:phenylalanine-4-hydroxylase